MAKSKVRITKALKLHDDAEVRVSWTPDENDYTIAVDDVNGNTCEVVVAAQDLIDLFGGLTQPRKPPGR